MILTFRINLILLFLMIAYPTLIFPQFTEEFEKPEEVSFSSVVGSGARAFGMGGAFIAVADDATAASWNPAGLAQLVKSEISIVYNVNNYITDFPGYSIYYPISQSYSIYPSYRINRAGKNINFLSFALPIYTKQYKIVPQICYQRVIDLSVGDKLEGTYNYTFDKTKYEYSQNGSYKGGFDVFALSIALKFSQLLSIASTLNFWFNGENSNYNLRLLQDLTYTSPFNPPKDELISTRNRYKISGYNTNIGILLNLQDKYKIGFVFRTPVRLDFEENFKSFKLGELDSSKSFTRTADLNLPFSIGFGVSYRPLRLLTVSSDFTNSNWSDSKLKAIKKNYLDGTEQIILEEPFPGNKLSGNKRKQNNTKQFRIGAEYIFLIKKYLVPVRTGFFTNTPYITDGNDKSITYLGFTTGLGVGIGNFLFDMAFVYQNGNSFYRKSSTGEREFTSNQFYFSAIYRFDIL
ncbi:outer membrane protein transport protein [candidate division KSB1 bacterium]|nr:outer membrane protein transport protein [candidate division KSB1 bacterium]